MLSFCVTAVHVNLESGDRELETTLEALCGKVFKEFTKCQCFGTGQRVAGLSRSGVCGGKYRIYQKCSGYVRAMLPGMGRFASSSFGRGCSIGSASEKWEEKLIFHNCFSNITKLMKET